MTRSPVHPCSWTSGRPGTARIRICTCLLRRTLPLSDPEHFKHAYRELAGMFGLDIQPTRAERAPLDQKTGIAGFPPNEELGLDERVSSGVSRSNCEMLVLDATGGGL